MSTGHRRQIAGRRQQHAQHAQQHAAERTLQGDTAHAPADMQQLIDLLQRAVEDHRTRRFGGHIAGLTKGNADGGGRQGRRIIDAIPHKHRIGPPGFRAHQRQLLLRALTGIDFLDADLVRQIAHLTLAVARNQ